MMMHLIEIAFESSKMVIKVKLPSLTTIIAHFSDDSSFDRLQIITFGQTDTAFVKSVDKKAALAFIC